MESREVEFIKGPRGGLIFLLGDHRYRISQRYGDAIYWRCIHKSIGCNARAITHDGTLVSGTTSKHLCDTVLNPSSVMENSVNDSSIIHETSTNEDKSNLSSFIMSSRGKTTLIFEDYKYRCQARKGHVAYWGCMQEGCKARAITENGSLKKTFGTHVCDFVMGNIEKPSAEISGNYDPDTRQTDDNNDDNNEDNNDAKHNSEIKPNSEDFCMPRCLQNNLGTHAHDVIVESTEESNTDISGNCRPDTSQGNYDPNPTFEIKQNSGELRIPRGTPVAFDTSIFGNQILLLKKFKYNRTNRASEDKGYWICAQRKKKCRARAVTRNGCLLSTSGIHVCVPPQETLSSPQKIQQASKRPPNEGVKEEVAKDNLSNLSCSASRTFEEAGKPCKTEETFEAKEINDNEAVNKVRMSYATDNIGRKSIFVSGVRFRRTHKASENGREYWKCFRSDCPAKAITLNRRLKRVYGDHCCGLAEDTIVLEENGRSISSNIKEMLSDASPEGDQENSDPNPSQTSETQFAHKSVIRNKGSKSSILVIKGRRYLLNRSSSKIGKLYWHCARKGCKAGAVTFKSRFRKTFGNHVCGSPEKPNEMPSVSRANNEKPILVFTLTGAGIMSLFIDNQKYKRTHRLSKTDTTYWQCMDESCQARAVTEKGLFKKMYGDHTCEAGKKTPHLANEKSRNLLVIDDENEASQSPPSYTSSSEDEKQPSIQQNKILRQRNLPEIFSCQSASRSRQKSKKLESTSKAHSDFPSPSTSQTKESGQTQLQSGVKQEKAQRKREKPRSEQPGTSGYKKKCMNSHEKKSYASLEERVKIMPHLQPRVMVSRFLTAALEKVSERRKWANDLAAEADRLHYVNIVSIANLSLRG